MLKILELCKLHVAHADWHFGSDHMRMMPSIFKKAHFFLLFLIGTIKNKELINLRRAQATTCFWSVFYSSASFHHLIFTFINASSKQSTFASQWLVLVKLECCWHATTSWHIHKTTHKTISQCRWNRIRCLLLLIGFGSSPSAEGCGATDFLDVAADDILQLYFPRLEYFTKSDDKSESRSRNDENSKQSDFISKKKEKPKENKNCKQKIGRYEKSDLRHDKMKTTNNST